jgi:opacity protein-like surface antigen
MTAASWKQLCIILCVITFARVATARDLEYHGAQTAGVPRVSGKSPDVGATELGIWAGYSGDNPSLVGRSKNRTFFELNLQYARVLETGGTWVLKYTAEIVPVANVRQPRQDVINGKLVDLPGNTQKIYGFGVTPIGLQMNLRRGHVLQPYINGTVGILYFREQVPVTDSSKFNFTLGLGAGVQIWYRENQSIQLGYKYHHISNGYTASRNPGMDSNLFYISYTLSWR